MNSQLPQNSVYNHYGQEIEYRNWTSTECLAFIQQINRNLAYLDIDLGLNFGSDKINMPNEGRDPLEFRLKVNEIVWKKLISEVIDGNLTLVSLKDIDGFLFLYEGGESFDLKCRLAAKEKLGFEDTFLNNIEKTLKKFPLIQSELPQALENIKQVGNAKEMGKKLVKTLWEWRSSFVAEEKRYKLTIEDTLQIRSEAFGVNHQHEKQLLRKSGTLRSPQNAEMKKAIQTEQLLTGKEHSYMVTGGIKPFMKQFNDNVILPQNIYANNAVFDENGFMKIDLEGNLAKKGGKAKEIKEEILPTYEDTEKYPKVLVTMGGDSILKGDSDAAPKEADLAGYNIGAFEERNPKYAAKMIMSTDIDFVCRYFTEYVDFLTRITNEILEERKQELDTSKLSLTTKTDLQTFAEKWHKFHTPTPNMIVVNQYQS